MAAIACPTLFVASELHVCQEEKLISAFNKELVNGTKRMYVTFLKMFMCFQKMFIFF